MIGVVGFDLQVGRHVGRESRAVEHEPDSMNFTRSILFELVGNEVRNTNGEDAKRALD